MINYITKIVQNTIKLFVAGLSILMIYNECYALGIKQSLDSYNLNVFTDNIDGIYHDPTLHSKANEVIM